MSSADDDTPRPTTTSTDGGSGSGSGSGVGSSIIGTLRGEHQHQHQHDSGAGGDSAVNTSVTELDTSTSSSSSHHLHHPHAHQHQLMLSTPLQHSLQAPGEIPPIQHFDHSHHHHHHQDDMQHQDQHQSNEHHQHQHQHQHHHDDHHSHSHEMHVDHHDHSSHSPRPTPLLGATSHQHMFHPNVLNEFPPHPHHHHIHHTPLHHPFTHGEHGPPPMSSLPPSSHSHHDHSLHDDHHHDDHGVGTPLHHPRRIEAASALRHRDGDSEQLPSNDFSISPQLTSFRSPQLTGLQSDALNSMQPLPPSVSPTLGSRSPHLGSLALGMSHLTSFISSSSPPLRPMRPQDSHLHGVIDAPHDEHSSLHHHHDMEDLPQAATSEHHETETVPSQPTVAAPTTTTKKGTTKKGSKRKHAANTAASKLQKVSDSRSLLRSADADAESQALPPIRDTNEHHRSFGMHEQPHHHHHHDDHQMDHDHHSHHQHYHHDQQHHQHQHQHHQPAHDDGESTDDDELPLTHARHQPPHQSPPHSAPSPVPQPALPTTALQHPMAAQVISSVPQAMPISAQQLQQLQLHHALQQHIQQMHANAAVAQAAQAAAQAAAAANANLHQQAMPALPVQGVPAVAVGMPVAIQPQQLVHAQALLQQRLAADPNLTPEQQEQLMRLTMMHAHAQAMHIRKEHEEAAAAAAAAIREREQKEKERERERILMQQKREYEAQLAASFAQPQTLDHESLIKWMKTLGFNLPNLPGFSTDTSSKPSKSKHSHNHTSAMAAAGFIQPTPAVSIVEQKTSDAIVIDDTTVTVAASASAANFLPALPTVASASAAASSSSAAASSSSAAPSLPPHPAELREHLRDPNYHPPSGSDVDTSSSDDDDGADDEESKEYHTGNKPRKSRSQPTARVLCPQCSESFESEKEMRAHMGGTHNIFLCLNLECQHPSHDNYTDLLKHLATAHCLPGEHPCNFCGQGFRQKGHRNEHERKHTNERPYHCTYPGCGSSFTKTSSLKQHEKTHSSRDAREHACPYCPMRFNQKSTLRSHIDTQHEHNRYPCKYHCGQSFLNRDKAIKHYAEYHQGEQLPKELKKQAQETMMEEEKHAPSDAASAARLSSIQQARYNRYAQDVLLGQRIRPTAASAYSSMPRLIPLDAKPALALVKEDDKQGVIVIDGAEPLAGVPSTDASDQLMKQMQPKDDIFQRVTSGLGPSLEELTARAAESGNKLVYNRTVGQLLIELQAEGNLERFLQHMQHPDILTHLQNLALVVAATEAAKRRGESVTEATAAVANATLAQSADDQAKPMDLDNAVVKVEPTDHPTLATAAAVTTVPESSSAALTEEKSIGQMANVFPPSTDVPAAGQPMADVAPPTTADVDAPSDASAITAVAPSSTLHVTHTPLVIGVIDENGQQVQSTQHTLIRENTSPIVVQEAEAMSSTAAPATTTAVPPVAAVASERTPPSMTSSTHDTEAAMASLALGSGSGSDSSKQQQQAKQHDVVDLTDDSEVVESVQSVQDVVMQDVPLMKSEPLAPFSAAAASSSAIDLSNDSLPHLETISGAMVPHHSAADDIMQLIVSDAPHVAEATVVAAIPAHVDQALPALPAGVLPMMMSGLPLGFNHPMAAATLSQHMLGAHPLAAAVAGVANLVSQPQPPPPPQPTQDELNARLLQPIIQALLSGQVTPEELRLFPHEVQNQLATMLLQSILSGQVANDQLVKMPPELQAQIKSMLQQHLQQHAQEVQQHLAHEALLRAQQEIAHQLAAAAVRQAAMQQSVAVAHAAMPVVAAMPIAAIPMAAIAAPVTIPLDEHVVQVNDDHPQLPQVPTVGSDEPQHQQHVHHGEEHHPAMDQSSEAQQQQPQEHHHPQEAASGEQQQHQHQHHHHHDMHSQHHDEQAQHHHHEEHHHDPQHEHAHDEHHHAESDAHHHDDADAHHHDGAHQHLKQPLRSEDVMMIHASEPEPATHHHGHHGHHDSSHAIPIPLPRHVEPNPSEEDEKQNDTSMTQEEEKTDQA